MTKSSFYPVILPCYMLSKLVHEARYICMLYIVFAV
jgi:hypothetical protein